jgi:hypothetical protein
MIDIVIGGEERRPRVRRAPDCLKCAYFRVSWDAAFPRACEIFELKSREMPSVLVQNATGRTCPAFQLKDGLRQ